MLEGDNKTFAELNEEDHLDVWNKNYLAIAESFFMEHVGQYTDIHFRWDFNHDLSEWERMVIRHSALYVISAMKTIAKLNKTKEEIINYP